MKSPSRKISDAAEEAGRGLKQVCPKCKKTVVLDPNAAALSRIIMLIQNYGCSECRLSEPGEDMAGTGRRASKKAIEKTKAKIEEIQEPAPPRRRRGKQQELPGMEAPAPAIDREIERLAEDFRAKLESWQQAQKDMTASRALLTEVMKRKGLVVHTYTNEEGEFRAEIAEIEKTSVRKVKHEEEEE